MISESVIIISPRLVIGLVTFSFWLLSNKIMIYIFPERRGYGRAAFWETLMQVLVILCPINRA